jgi:plastocyanin
MYKQVIGMKVKVFVLLFVLSAVILSGCTGDKTTDGDVNATDNINDTTGIANVTTDDVSGTPLDETEQNDTTTTEEQPAVTVPTEDNTSQGPQVIDTGIPRTFTVRLEKYLSSPNTLVIAPEDTVYWINFNDPIRLFVLISDNDLWENQSLGYRESFGYTFNETGTYNYSILGNPRMSGTIIVK